MRVRTALLLAAVAAATFAGAAPAQACQYAEPLFSNCAGYDPNRNCVYANGHVDMYEYRIACSPR